MFATVGQTLDEAAQEAPQRLAVVMPDGRRRTYAELHAESHRLARHFAEDGVEPGMRVLLMAPPSPEFFAATFALFHLGAIPVFLDPGMGVRNLTKCIELAAPHVMIGVAKAHTARILFGWQRGAWRKLYTLRSIGKMARIDTLPLTQTHRGTTAAILFTSGSTGAPKGVVYEHQHFLAQIALLKSTYGIQPGEVDVGTFPLFALFAPALGMTAVVPDMDFTSPGSVDPEKIFKAIEQYGATTMFGSPALLGRLASSKLAQHRQLHSLKRVISAGAPVSPDVLAAFARLLAPKIPIYTPYGATEALPITSVDSHEILSDAAQLTRQGKGILVGRPVVNTQVRIMKVTDEAISDWTESLALPRGEVGEIVVSGHQVTVAYDGLPQANALAKIHNLQSGQIMHRMGDLGYFDDSGRLWFCGRKAHRIWTRSGEIDSVPCEGIFDAHPDVAKTALVGRGERGQMRPVLCVETVRPLPRRARQELVKNLLALAASHPMTAQVADIRFFDELPVDPRHNAKILREKLKLRIDRRDMV